jgi:hypothetical protein
MDFLSDNFIADFFTNPRKTDKEFNQFINVKFTEYLNNTNLLANIVKDYETNKTGQSKYCDECKDLYILTNSIFDNYIKRINIPFNININDETNPDTKNNYKNKVLYFFDLEDLKKILASENLKESSGDDELNKKKILCKIISVIFIKIYIIIKSIHETFNNYKALVETDNEPLINDDSTLIQEPSSSEQDRTKEELRRQDEVKDEERDEARPREQEQDEVRTIEEARDEAREQEQEQEQEQDEARTRDEAKRSQPEVLPELGPQTVPELGPQTVPELGPQTVPELGPQTVPELPKTVPTLAPTLEQIKPSVPNPVINESVPNPNPNESVPNPNPNESVPNPSPNEAVPKPNEAVPNLNPSVGGNYIVDKIRDFFPFTNYEEDPPSETTVDPVKYKPTKNLFYSIFVILFTDYFELNSNNFSEKTLKETLDSISNEQFAKNLAKLAKYFCDEQRDDKRHKLFELDTITRRSIIFDDSIDTLSFLNLKVDYKKENQSNLEALKSKSGELDGLLITCKDYLKTICVHIVRDHSQTNTSESNRNPLTGGLNSDYNSDPLTSVPSTSDPLTSDPLTNEPIRDPLTSDPLTSDHNIDINSNPNRDSLTSEQNNDDLFKNINYKAFAFIKTILKKMIKHYFYNRRYLYTKIIKNIVVFDKKKKLITKIDDNLTYNKILMLTHKTKYKILELNYYIYKYSSAILKVFYDELNNLDKNIVAKKSSNIITRALNFNSSYGGKRNKNIIRKRVTRKNIIRKRVIRKRVTRKRSNK